MAEGKGEEGEARVESMRRGWDPNGCLSPHVQKQVHWPKTEL